MDYALKQISNKFIIQCNTADFHHEIIKYTYHGASSYLIDKFLIIGYDNLLFDKEITSTKPMISKPASQMKLPSLYSKSSQAYPFTLQIEPNILSEICSDYDKTLLDNNTIINLIFPNKPLCYYYESKTTFNLDKNNNELPQYYFVLFNSNPSSNDSIKKSYNGIAFCFYESLRGKDEHVYIVPKVFAILSEYPYYSTFAKLLIDIRRKFLTSSPISIPLECLIYNIVKYTPSPLYKDVYLNTNLEDITLNKKEKNINVLIDNNDTSKGFLFKQLTGYALIQINISRLFTLLTPQVVFKLFIFSYLEKDILVFSNSLEIISITMFTFMSLNFPVNDGNYYWLNATISYEDFIDGNSIFGNSSYPTMLGINKAYAKGYENKTNKGDHFILDIDNKNFDFYYQKEKEEVKACNLILSLIKNVIRDKADNSDKENLTLFRIMRRLYVDIESVIKKKTNINIYNPKLFDNINEEENAFIQEAFYRFILGMNSLLYRNISSHSKLDTKTNASDRNRAGETFYNEYNKAFKSTMKEEEKAFIGELEGTFKFSSFIEGFVKSHNDNGLYQIPFSFIDELTNIISLNNESKNGWSIDIKCLDVIKSFYQMNKDDKKKKENTISNFLNCGKSSNKDTFKLKKGGIIRRVGTTNFTSSKTDNDSDINVNFLEFQNCYNNNKIKDNIHREVSEYKRANRAIYINKEETKYKLYKYYQLMLDSNVILLYHHFIMDLKSETEIFPSLKQINTNNNNKNNKVPIHYFEYLVEQAFISSSHINIEYLIIYSIFNLFALSRSICNEHELVDQMLHSSCLLELDKFNMRKYYKELLYIFIHLSNQSSNSNGECSQQYKDSIGFCMFYLINNLRAKEIAGNQLLLKLLNSIKNDDSESAAATVPGLDNENNTNYFEVKLKYNVIKGITIDEGYYIKTAEQKLLINGIITNEENVYNGSYDKNYVYKYKDKDKEEDKQLPLISYKVDINKEEKVVPIYSPRKIFDTLNNFKNKILYEINNTSAEELNGVALEKYFANLVFYIRNIPKWEEEVKSSIHGLLLEIYGVMLRAKPDDDVDEDKHENMQSDDDDSRKSDDSDN